ncbi:MAG TPA: hypothetical protein VFD69_16495 [Vicinamibacterales bacterium]|nr:hypothetical protein [Vicinamibacterales bacterium]
MSATAAVVFLATAWVAQTEQPAAAQEGGAPAAQGRGGRGRQTGPVEPTPRLADGTVNLGRVPGEKGTWNVPYITNMAMRVVTGPGSSDLLPEIAAVNAAAAAARAGGAGRAGGGGRGGGRGGSKSEPWMPWSAAVYDYNSVNESKYDPEGYCLPPGGPRMMATPYQMEIIQLPEHKRIMMVFEGATHIWREVYMDGRRFPEDLNPTYLGYSIGRWEGDTLVVENKGFNENSWFDYFGHPHTDLMSVVERWTRPNKQTLHYEATVTDPGAYTRPFTVAWDISWNATSELPEYICQENNQYLNRLVDDFGQPIFGPRQQPGAKPGASRGTR